MFNKILDKQAQLARKEIEASVCPKCKSKLTEVGCLTIEIKDGSNLNGRYCSFCYRDFIAANIPKFEGYASTHDDKSIGETAVGGGKNKNGDTPSIIC